MPPIEPEFIHPPKKIAKPVMKTPPQKPKPKPVIRRPVKTPVPPSHQKTRRRRPMRYKARPKSDDGEVIYTDDLSQHSESGLPTYISLEE